MRLITSTTRKGNAITTITDNHDGRVITFGFEAEFERNAGPLARALHERNVCGSPEIHGWHCDCSTCEDDGEMGWYYKVQRDSTVDGEVISRVFTEWDEALDAFQQLQEAAVEADAEPGWNAGIHVHVAQPRSRGERARAFAAFLLWEDALIHLAAGRFPYLREMNTGVRRTVEQNIAYRGTTTRSNARTYVAEAIDRLAYDLDDYEAAHELYVTHHDADRHSHLNVNTRFSTWEWRIWNSTRSAWRMELAARLAVAWRQRALVRALLTYGGQRNLPGLIDVVAGEWQGDDRLAVLMQRQADYLRDSVHDTPPAFAVA